VTLVERDGDLDEDINLTARTVIERELARCGVQIRLNTDVEDVSGATAWMSENGIRRGQPCDAVVWTARRNDPVRDGMGQAARRVLAVGECGGARGLYEATSSAYRAACRL
jgi:NADH dehydrogenase FAD-containing subunit